MARLSGNEVINTEVWPDNAAETADLKNVADWPVQIGDEYQDDGYYRDGIRVLSPMEALNAQLADMAAALAVMGVTE